ncbi:isochorismatase family protein [Nonomuraea cavernae]|uniref:isochorismatase family protein n=1 Tax=Nonomuraea cavernae TaxID=2045107 RepID=UPI0033CC8398
MTAAYEDLGEDYSAHGFAQRLGFGSRPALVVVDFVNAYVTPGCDLYAGVESAVEAGAQVLAAARKAGIPVIFTRVVYQPGGADGGLFYKKARALKQFEGHSHLGAIVPQLTPREGELVIDKQFASAFFGTSLSSILAASGRDSVIVIGLSTSGCVRATSLDACQHGYIPIVVREAVGDRDERPHEQALFDLDAKYADVVGLDEVVAHLGGL